MQAHRPQHETNVSMSAFVLSKYLSFKRFIERNMSMPSSLQHLYIKSLQHLRTDSLCFFPIITHREIGISSINSPDTLMPGPAHDSDVTPAIEIRVPPQPLAHEDFSDHHTSCCQNAGDCMKDEQCSEDPYMFDEFSPSPEAKHDAYMPGRYMASSGA